MTIPPAGTLVKAKRMGWDEQLSNIEEMDMSPYEEESDDLEGPLAIHVVSGIPDVDNVAVYTVGGQEADPSTIEPIDSVELIE